MNIRKAIQEFIKEYISREKIYSQVCIVDSVDTSERTCLVTPINGDAQRKARLQASISLSDGIYIVPAIGSKVLLTYINNLSGVITKYSSIDKIHIKTTNKIKIENSSEDLKTILNNLITAIKAITVPTPAGTSGTPLNVSTFTNINTSINNLLE